MSDEKRLTRAEVSRRVHAIRRMANDDESAHGAEDDLRADVLQAVANGDADSQEMARIALTTADISFARWCA